MADYSTKGHYYINEPRREVLKVSKLLGKGASILDIGAGYGNNSKYLLNQGHLITALEPNKKATEGLAFLKDAFSKKFEIRLGSVDSYKPKAHYDAIVCCMVLHFLENRKSVLAAVNNMKSWTRPGGLNLITSYLDGNHLTSDYSFLLKPNELREMYANWEILWYEESHARSLKSAQSIKDILKIACGQRGYKAARIIARKPQSKAN